MWVAVSPAPRMRWTFWARRRATAVRSVPSVRPGPARSGSLPCANDRCTSLVSATDHLDGVELCRAPGRVDGGEQDDDDGADERGVILVGVLGHHEALDLDQPFHLDRDPPQPLDRQLAEGDAAGGADQ